VGTIRQAAVEINRCEKINPKKAFTAEYAEERGGKSKDYAHKAIHLFGNGSIFCNHLFSLRTSASSAVQVPLIE
jgi:hypothetical protein